MKKFYKIFLNSLLSLKSNIKNYILILSVVIVTFTIILVILGYRDTQFHFDYREINLLPDNIVTASFDRDNINESHVQQFLSSMDHIEGIKKNEILSAGGGSSSNQYKNKKDCDITFINTYVDTNLFSIPIQTNHGYQTIKLLEGRNFSLKDTYDNKYVIISDLTSQLLFGTEHGVGKYIYLYTDDFIEEKHKVIGIYEHTQDEYDNYKNLSNTKNYSSTVYLNKNNMNKNIYIESYNYTYHTDKNDDVRQLAESFQIDNIFITNQSKLIYRNRSRENFINEMIILLIISAILAVNIQGIFKTMLYKRRKEIGIRLSLGASKKDIFMQFLIECIFVLFIAIILSTMLSINIIHLIVLYMRKQTPDMYLYLSSFTIKCFFGMTFLQAISLSLTTSLKAVNVDIIELLNPEE